MTDIQDLKAIAERCKGHQPLRFMHSYGALYIRNDNGIVFDVHQNRSFPDFMSQNKDYADLVLAANPAAVLGLIAEIERLERKNSNQAQTIREYSDLVMGGDVSLGMLRADIRVTTGERDQLKAENEALRKHAPSSEIIWCACGDGYPANSYGAGFMDANGGVCESCDAATENAPTVRCPLDLFQGLRDSAAEEAAQYRASGMADIRPHRMQALDKTVNDCDALIAVASKEADNG